MARTKYRIGTLVCVKETDDAPSHVGVVEEIHLLKDDRTLYKVTGLDDGVEDEDIAAAYREIKPRKATVRTVKKAKKAAKAVAQAA